MTLQRLMTVAALVCGLTAMPAFAETLTLDKEQSKIEFVGKKSDGKHDGGFRKFEAQASADFETPKNSTLSVKIDATSLWADNGKLTNHLKNPDFFDVRKYPTITFESTKVVPGEPRVGKIVGKLTMLGETKELAVPVQVEASEEQVTMDADFSIDRTRWGMNYGVGDINKDVDVRAHFVFER